MTNEQRSREALSRRGVLKGTATLAGAAATAGHAGAYRDLDVAVPATQNDGEGRTFQLLGIVGGWMGIAPHEVDALSNPTLRLIEGEQHEVVWTNGDGATHNFNITTGDAVNGGGEILESTETITEQGATTSLEFTPQEEMEEYFCQPHPAQMRGPIELISPDEVHELVVNVEDEDGDPLGAEVALGDRHSFSNVAARPSPPQEEEDERAVARFDLLEDGEYEIEAWTYRHERITETVTIDGGNEEVTITVPTTELDEPTETYSLALEEGQWVGQSPDAIADETNPTLDLESGETYAVEWENTVGQHQPEAENRNYEPLPGHNFVIASAGETNQWITYLRSDFTAEEGATQTVEFLAKDDMGVYLDQSQLDAVGEISVGGAGGETADAEDTTAETEDTTAETDGNETADVDGNETTETAENETTGSD